MFRSTLTNQLTGQYTRWPWDSSIESDPASLLRPRVELRAICVVYPHGFAESFQPREIGRASIECLPRCLAPESAHRHTVLQPGGVTKCLPPQALGKTRHVKECPYLLHEGAIKSLGNPIELRCIMHSESPSCTNTGEVLIKSSAQVFSPVVGAQDLNRVAVVLSPCPCLELLVEREGVALHCKKVHEGETCRIVCEGDKIAAASSGGNWGRPPDIGMYFVAELCSLLADSEFWNGLPCGTHENARLTVLFPRARVQCDSGDKATLNELVCASRCDMPHAPV